MNVFSGDGFFDNLFETSLLKARIRQTGKFVWNGLRTS